MILKTKTFSIYLLTLLVVALITSCKEDDDARPSYLVPETYTFENVKYTGQTVRIRLLDSLGKLINSAKTQHVSKDQLLALYNNSNSLFGGSQKLSDKVAPGTEAQMMAWFDSVDVYSPMQITSSKNWFITPGGLDISQLVQKTMMGSLHYYQATSTYLAGIGADDNVTVKEGEGTAMEHHWDEAFGYYGAPIDFSIYSDEDITIKKFRDTNGNSVQDIPAEKAYFHAGYSLTRDQASKNFPEADKTNFRTTLMNNFIKGRAAIVNKDYSTRDEAKKVILETWEKQTAANALHYINDVKKSLTANSTTLDDLHTRYHAWAEAKGFFNATNPDFNIYSKIKSAQWNEINPLIGEKPSDATISKLNEAAEKIKQVYSFSDYQRDNF